MIPPGVIAAQCRPPADDAYAAVVTGLPGGAPLAYWRFSSTAGIIDAMPGARHGTYDGAVTLVDPLPADSDQATLLPGTVVGTIPHDPGLALPAFSLSLWFKMPSIPSAGPAVVFSKDIPNLNDGDFMVFFFDEDLFIQFQSSSAQHRVTVSGLVPDVVHHFVVTADGSGFEVWQDGRLLTTRADFTAAWVNNGADILLGTATHVAQIAEVVLDELALYDRVLTDAEIIALSQRAAAPVAGDASAVVPAAQTVVIDVAAASHYVGRKADLGITVTAQGSHGTATVTPANDIEYAAAPTESDAADSFSYTIADANGISAPAAVGMTVQGTASAGGGTLVYRWEPKAEWMSGPLSGRNNSFVANLARWNEGAAPGSLTALGVPNNGGQQSYCFNRAPTDHPSIEIRSVAGQDAPILLGVQLYPHLQSGQARHLRVVMEIKTCKSSDPTTHKANGLGTTGGSYPNWKASHEPGGHDNANVQTKYFVGAYAGTQPAGGGTSNWWNNSSFTITRAGYRWQSGSSSKRPSVYSYNFDRPNQFGSGQDDYTPPVTINDTGVHGVWHRVEIEVKLTTPATVPENAIRKVGAVRPTGGDGFVKNYLTKDIDGELGPPGTRQEIGAATGLIFFPKHDEVGSDNNMHTLACLGGFWLTLTYGGSTFAQAETWAWVRKIEVYRHD